MQQVALCRFSNVDNRKWPAQRLAIEHARTHDVVMGNDRDDVSRASRLSSNRQYIEGVVVRGALHEFHCPPAHRALQFFRWHIRRFNLQNLIVARIKHTDNALCRRQNRLGALHEGFTGLVAAQFRSPRRERGTALIGPGCEHIAQRIFVQGQRQGISLAAPPPRPARQQTLYQFLSSPKKLRAS